MKVESGLEEFDELVRFQKEESKKLEEFDDLFKDNPENMEKGFINPGFPGEPIA